MVKTPPSDAGDTGLIPGFLSSPTSLNKLLSISFFPSLFLFLFLMLEKSLCKMTLTYVLKVGGPGVFVVIQISRSVMSDSLQPHESQHPRPPCPSPTPGVHPDSRPSSQ